MAQAHEIVDITPDNVEDYDMLCKKSKKSEDGYQSKLVWFKARYREGLRIKLLRVEDRGKMTSRGFIEYVPGEYAWRAVSAPGYMLIHCLWVVGKAKGKGYGSELIHKCIDDARGSRRVGVAAVSTTKHWLVDSRVLVKNGFEAFDEAPPSFGLDALKFGSAASPKFPSDWPKRLESYGTGLSIVYADQCPYNADAVATVLETAQSAGIEAKSIRLTSAKELQRRAPSAYGVFGVVYNGNLLSYTYIGGEHLIKRIRELDNS